MIIAKKWNLEQKNMYFFGFELSACHFLGMCFRLPLEPCLQLFFALVIYFSDRVLCFCWSQPQTAILLPMPSSSWDHRYKPPHPAYLLRWVLLTFCLGWPGTVILLSFASWVVEITSVSHYTQLCFPVLNLVTHHYCSSVKVSLQGKEFKSPSNFQLFIQLQIHFSFCVFEGPNPPNQIQILWGKYIKWLILSQLMKIKFKLNLKITGWLNFTQAKRDFSRNLN
jgi:hypothetical protein